MKNKRSQMKIQQTAFMILAVTLFFVFVGLFVLGFWLSGLKESASLLEEKNAILLVSKLANSPEFACGESFGGNRIRCVDADKVIMLSQEIQKYRDFWGVTDIKIRKIYPESEVDIECTLSSYPNCNIFNIILDDVRGTYDSSFVSLCRKELKNNRVYDRCELALLEVSYEKKGVDNE